MAKQGNNGLFRWRVWQSPQLKAFLRRAPRLFSRAAGLMVNQVAWDMRGEMEGSLTRLLMIRRPGFVRRQLWAQKARVGSSSPVALVGSTRTRDGKFDGWRAQQFGSKVDRTRVPTLVARGGSKRRVMQRRARLLAGRDFPDSREIVGKSSPGAVIAMMRILARRGDRRPFVVYPGEHPRFRGGLYEMRGRKDRRHRKARLRMLQDFGSKNEQPERVDWVNPAWRAYQSSHSARAEWRKAVNRVGLRDVLRVF